MNKGPLSLLRHNNKPDLVFLSARWKRSTVALPKFFIDKGETASQANEIVNDVYCIDTVTHTTNYVQFWFRRLRKGIFYVKDAPRRGRSVVEYVDKITEIIKVEWHVSSCTIALELEMNHKTVFNHLHKVGLKNKLDVWVPHQLTQET
ncbi:histone-lysine N-methyltransferase SETMAR [Trichonephila clavipes]|nr:histone-lysine N-methyltransferase SETMAR [Trichonephila clavipes]